MGLPQPDGLASAQLRPDITCNDRQIAVAHFLR